MKIYLCLLVLATTFLTSPIWALPNADARYNVLEMNKNILDLKSPDENVRLQASNYFDDNPAIPDAYPAILDALNTDKSIAVRGNLVMAISHYKDENSIPAIKKFLNDCTGVKGDNSNEIYTGFLGLTLIGGDEANEVVERGIASDDIRFKNSAIGIWGYYKKDIAKIAPFLTDKEKSTRIVVIQCMGKIGTPEAFDRLQPLLAQKADIDIYNAILAAMSTIKDDRATDAIIRAMSDDNPAIRLSAINHLPYGKNDKVVAALIKALKDTSVGVRAGAAKALGTEAFVDKTAFQPLLDALADEAGVVSASVALSLGAYKDKDAIKPLQLALRNDYNLTRSNAILSLFAIGGDEVMDIIGKAMSRELDHKVLSSLIYVMKKMKTDKVAASQYIGVAIKNSKEDNDKLFNEGHSAQIQLGGRPKPPTPAVE